MLLGTEKNMIKNGLQLFLTHSASRWQETNKRRNVNFQMKKIFVKILVFILKFRKVMLFYKDIIPL